MNLKLVKPVLSRGELDSISNVFPSVCTVYGDNLSGLKKTFDRLFNAADIYDGESSIKDHTAIVLTDAVSEKNKSFRMAFAGAHVGALSVITRLLRNVAACNLLMCVYTNEDVDLMYYYDNGFRILCDVSVPVKNPTKIEEMLKELLTLVDEYGGCNDVFDNNTYRSVRDRLPLRDICCEGDDKLKNIITPGLRLLKKVSDECSYRIDEYSVENGVLHLGVYYEDFDERVFDETFFEKLITAIDEEMSKKNPDWAACFDYMESCINAGDNYVKKGAAIYRSIPAVESAGLANLNLK